MIISNWINQGIFVLCSHVEFFVFLFLFRLENYCLIILYNIEKIFSDEFLVPNLLSHIQFFVVFSLKILV